MTCPTHPTLAGWLAGRYSCMGCLRAYRAQKAAASVPVEHSHSPADRLARIVAAAQALLPFAGHTITCLLRPCTCGMEKAQQDIRAVIEGTS